MVSSFENCLLHLLHIRERAFCLLGKINK